VITLQHPHTQLSIITTLHAKKPNFSHKDRRTFSLISSDILGKVFTSSLTHLQVSLSSEHYKEHIPLFQFGHQIKLLDDGRYEIHRTNIFTYASDEIVLKDFKLTCECLKDEEKMRICNTPVEKIKTLDDGKLDTLIRSVRPTTLHPKQIIKKLGQALDCILFLDVVPQEEYHYTLFQAYQAPKWNIDLNLLKTFTEPEEGPECVICYNGIEQYGMLVPCHHSKFCLKCARHFVGKPCPLCNAKCTAVNQIYL